MVDREKLTSSTKKLIVLLVEDEHSSRRDLKAILEVFFNRVDIAIDGEDGIKRYREHYENTKFFYDLVITDLMMPKKHGLDLIQEIQEINLKQHIVISSAYNDYDNLINAVNLGVDGFLHKPFNYKHFLELVDRVVKSINLEESEEFKKAELERKVDAKTRQIQEQVKIDSLTKIPNFFALVEDLKSSTEQAFMVFDIERFEDINSTYGMEFGNSVLKSVANLLDTLIPLNGKLYRIGSDEFGVVIVDYGKNQVEELVHTVNSFFKSYQIEIEEVEISIAFSVGINYQAKEVISGGKIAAKEAKEEQGSCFKIYNPNSDFTKHQRENLHKVHILKKLLDLDRVVPYFQPIVNSVENRIVKYEALARLEDECGKIHTPGYFIEAARLTGLLTAITKSMISKSFKICSEQNIDISINISEQDFSEGYLTGFLKNRLSKFNLEANRITLEVLETVTVNGSDDIARQLDELRDLGFIVALDDFGSENSNFSRLLDIHPDIIKIDGVFIRNLRNCDKSKRIVKSIIFLAREINAKVVAEFVQDRETVELIKTLGIELVQGYYYGEPVKVDKLAKEISKEE